MSGLNITAEVVFLSSRIFLSSCHNRSNFLIGKATSKSDPWQFWNIWVSGWNLWREKHQHIDRSTDLWVARALSGWWRGVIPDSRTLWQRWIKTTIMFDTNWNTDDYHNILVPFWFHCDSFQFPYPSMHWKPWICKVLGPLGHQFGIYRIAVRIVPPICKFQGKNSTSTNP